MIFESSQNEIAFAGLTLQTLTVLIIVFVIWFASGILLALWVRKDIHSHGLVGAPYIIIVALSSIIGLSVYLLVRYNAKCALEEDEAACIVEELKKEDV